jgi:glycosyltransferase involved in cell wall biosynthesis
MPPLCTIIIATYNREKYVAAALKSVLAQTRDFELVVWDDGSTDQTLTIVRDLADKDPRVRIVASENRGQCFALNTAAAMTRGEYLGWLDSDDLLAPTALEETAAVLDARPEVGLVYTRYMTIDAAGRLGEIGKRCLIPYSPQRLLLDFMTFHFRLIRREAFERAGGLDESMVAAADYDLCLKLSELTQVAHVPKPLYLYRVHDDSISVQRRLEQIMQSRDAIARALVRRNMDSEFEAHVELVGRFQLRRKNRQT